MFAFLIENSRDVLSELMYEFPACTDIGRISMKISTRSKPTTRHVTTHLEDNFVKKKRKGLVHLSAIGRRSKLP